MIAKTPSTREYAPNSRMSVLSVRPGFTKASTPNTMASTPRNTSAHQFRASTMFIRDLLGWGSRLAA